MALFTDKTAFGEDLKLKPMAYILKTNKAMITKLEHNNTHMKPY